MFRILFTALCLSFSAVAGAQFATSYSNAIKTPQMMLNDDWKALPVMELGSNDVVHFSFDEMSHVYHRYTCRITHCNADGTQSDLLEIDYLEGFNDFVIEEWENSHNTTRLYTHYSFDVPNDDINLKVSGNYRLDVFDDESDGESPVLSFGFSVVEPLVSIDAWVGGDTDRTFNAGEQQLSFVVDHSRCNVVSPASDLVPVVMQNRRRDNMVVGVTPTYMTGAKAEYVHNGKLIFEAGNEYRRFELTDPDMPGMNVEEVVYHDSAYHALLYIDKPRFSYTNGIDENGRFYINTTEGCGSPLEADYVNVHFAISMLPRMGGRFYLSGDFCNGGFCEENRLVYDAAEGYYFVSALLKLGVYNYQYVWLPDNGTSVTSAPAEGSFYNTGNEYLVYVFHREFGARYDKLVGFAVVESAI